jgi:beta-glucosidase
VPYDHKNAERDDRNYGRNGFSPQWEFGDGLSYTEYKYDALVLEKDTLSVDEDLSLRVLVTNEGSLAGKEAVQVYVRDEYASITPPNRRLRAFEKVLLDPGETREVSFRIPVYDLGFIDANNEYVVEPGVFTVMVGDLSRRFVVR